MPKMIECCDDSSRKAFVSKCSVSRMKHIQTRYLWIQEHLALKHFVLAKVGTLLNRADVLTKQLSASFIHKHLTVIGTMTDTRVISTETFCFGYSEVSAAASE